MNLMHISVAFIVGFLFGGLICYLTVIRLVLKHQLNDELTAARRELANAKRGLNDFFNEADAAFSKLDENYRKLADVLSSGAAKLNQNHELFILERADSPVSAAEPLPAPTPATPEQAAVMKAFKPLASKQAPTDAAKAIQDAPASVQVKAAAESIDLVQNKENVLKPKAVDKETAPAQPAPAAPQGQKTAAPDAPAAQAQPAEPTEDGAAPSDPALTEKTLTEPPKDFVEEKPAPTKI